jgi:DNA-binding response OmpR family regulator
VSVDETKELILLADDSMITLTVMSARLLETGYDVVTATRGDVALTLAHERRPQLVVLDIAMPGMDGIEVLQRLREDHTFAEVPIVLLTSHSLSEYLQEGLEAGADAYLVKPVGPGKLTSLLEELLRGRGPVAA